MATSIDNDISQCWERIQDPGNIVQDYLKDHPKVADCLFGAWLFAIGYNFIVLGKHFVGSPPEFFEKNTIEQITVFALVGGGELTSLYGLVTAAAGNKKWFPRAVDGFTDSLDNLAYRIEKLFEYGANKFSDVLHKNQNHAK